MKIENDLQADATHLWIERVGKHILELNHIDKISSIDTSDQTIIAGRLQEILRASLITYTEDKNYGRAPQEFNEKTKRRIREFSETSVTNSKRTDPTSQGTEHEENKTEVDHDLSSESFHSQR